MNRELMQVVDGRKPIVGGRTVKVIADPPVVHTIPSEERSAPAGIGMLACATPIAFK